MAKIGRDRPAFGPPIDPKWTRSDKDGVGSAYSALSPLWFTVAKGIVTEVYYPTIDLPQIRDLQYLATDGTTFFHDERRGFDNDHVLLDDGVLGFRITNTSHPTPANQTYRITKQVIAAPDAPCLLIHTRIDVPGPLRAALKLYALVAPHLDGTGWHNTGYVADTPYGQVLVAHGTRTWLALGATVPFLKCSCGIVGRTDGWQDLNGNEVPGNQPFLMDWDFDTAQDSNIALMGQLDLSGGDEFVLGLAFGETLNSALLRLREGLSLPFQAPLGAPEALDTQLSRFTGQWRMAQQGLLAPGAGVTGDNGRLYRTSRSVLLTHEDAIYGGALIASLSIPWGEFSDDQSRGYHKVWTRDMCNSASGLLASGDTETPLRALVFLATVQREDGSFFQNFYVNGDPADQNVQLDEIAFPILLAWRMQREHASRSFDPYPMVRRAAVALILNGPMTQQERWEENEGYSPSTLAATIAALVCAASFAQQRGEQAAEQFFLEYADFLESHLERWTVADDCDFLHNVRHYVRILPTSVRGDDSRKGPFDVPARPSSDGDPNLASVPIGNRTPEYQPPFLVPARNLFDAGFLELVRYGIRPPDDPLVLDSLRILDLPAVGVRVDYQQTPDRAGTGWRRYNEDGYGNHPDGQPFDTKTGQGRGGTWPLLTGERGHYELAAGNDPRPLIRAMEHFAVSTGLLPEQLWDLPDLPAAHMRFGYPTGAAMPLAWAHAEYIKLVRSTTDSVVFDRIPEVAARYLVAHAPSRLEIWNYYRQIDSIPRNSILRVLLGWPFRLHWSVDDWAQTSDTMSASPIPGLYYVDVPAPAAGGEIVFTLYWPDSNRWQNNIDYRVHVP